MSTNYRLAPPISARLIGAAVILLAVATLLTTGLVLIFSWPILVLWILTTVGALIVTGLGWYLAHTHAVHLTDTGYRVRFLRGPGVHEGRWVDVDDVVSANVGGALCLVLRLRDGRSTAIPVAALAVERDVFAKAVREHLARGQRLRPLD